MSLRFDPGHIRKSQRLVVRTLLELLEADQLVLYFDSTSVSDLSYRQSVWALKGHKTVLPTGRQFRTFKMLVATTKSQIQAVQFLQRQSSAKIETFLGKTLHYLQHKWPTKEVFVFLDNSRLQKGEFLVALTKRFNVRFLFNVPHFPALNLVEHLFEILKRPLRQKFSLRPFIAIDCLLNAIKSIKPSDFHQALARQRRAIISLLVSNSW